MAKKSKTAQLVESLVKIDYNKFVKAHKEAFEKKFTVPLGGTYVMGDVGLTNLKYIQRRARWINSNPNDNLVNFWKTDIISLLNRIYNNKV